MKRIIYVVAMSLGIAGAVLAGTVAVNPEGSRAQYSFALEPGDRIIVVRAGVKTVTVSPASAKIIDLKIPAGKRLNGQLILN